MNYMNTFNKRLVCFSLAFVVTFSMGVSALAMDGLSVTLTAPEAIGNLSVPYFTTNSATLRWSVASAADDKTATYDIRYSTSSITDLNFQNTQTTATKPIMYVDVRPNGTERMYTVTGLTPGIKYYFALKSKYESSGWSGISDIPSMTLPTQTPTTSTFPNTDLSFGQTSASVSDFQKFLTDQGLYTGPITGYFGPMTKKAAILFQQKNKITPAAGFIGPMTRGVIKGVLTAKITS